MKNKTMSYLAACLIAIFALCPPLYFCVQIIPDTILWHWLVLASGLLAMLFLFSKANVFIKAITAYFFINCFFSKCPFNSFTAYLTFIACAYFYLLCLEIKNWQAVFKTLCGLLLLNLILMALAFLGRDNLLNFSKVRPDAFGILGNMMQTKAFIALLLIFLWQAIKPNKRNIVIGLFLILTIALIYTCVHQSWVKFLSIRSKAWLEAIKLGLRHPFVGYGLAEFKILFSALKPDFIEKGRTWFSPHNFLVHLFFETGSIGVTLVLGLIIRTLIRIRHDLQLFSGGIMLFFVLCWTFIDRSLNTILILIAFLAFCEYKIKEKRYGGPDPS